MVDHMCFNARKLIDFVPIHQTKTKIELDFINLMHAYCMSLERYSVALRPSIFESEFSYFLCI